MRVVWLGSAVLAGLPLVACQTPAHALRSVPAQMEVSPVVEELPRPMGLNEILGIWESEERSGQLARAGLRYVYIFHGDGQYSASVLAPATQDALGRDAELLLVQGSWALEEGELDLGANTPPFQAQLQGARMLLTSSAGGLVLRRLHLQTE